jgi:lysophospholipase L1-like esterase
MKSTIDMYFQKIKLSFVRQALAILAVMLVLGAGRAAAAPDGSLTDTNLTYFGRWDFSSLTQYVSYWGGAYIKVNFSGTTVKIKLGHSSCYYAKIDGGSWVTYSNVTGTVNLTPTPLAAGTHTLSVAQGKDYDYVFNFQGLTLDAGATTSSPVVSSNMIEFIGDSITAGYTCAQADVSDYAWVCSENLGVEHTQIAYPGVDLVTTTNHGTGQDVQYFKEQSFNYPSSPNWDFSTYTARLVVVNLGQNDIGANGISLTVFQSDYTNFLANIRAKYPNADIFALRTFGGLAAAQTQAAVAARNAAGDAKVHYVDTTGWLGSYPGSDWDDGVHPSVAGHIKVASQLQPILAAYVGNALTNGTYKLINRNSGLALDAKGQHTTNGTPIQQYAYNAGDNQKWTVSNLGNGQYKIIGVQSGRSLDVKGQSTANGAIIQLYDDNGGDNQKWVITPTSGGYDTVQGVQSGKMMEVLGSATTNGAAVDQWSGSGGNNQQWSFQAP